MRAAGHGVRLLAPAAGAVLVGSGPSEVEALLSWDSVETARLLAGETSEGAVGTALREAGAAVAYTRAADVLAALRSCTQQLIAWDPAPPADGPHASVWLTRPLGDLGLEPAAGLPAGLRFSADETAAAASFVAALPSGFLAVHPGSGSPRKNWPASRFVDLARRLAGSAPWLLVLGPAEEALALDNTGAVVARSLPLRVLGALLARAGLVVGNDAGVTHLAAAAGAPTLALFGPTSPGLWAPVGRRVRCVVAPAGRLEQLTVEQVAAESARLGESWGASYITE